MSAETITLTPVEPTSLVLCDSPFLATLAQVERAVSALRVTDAPSAQTAADLQQRLTTAGQKLEAARKAIKEPFLAKGREIDEAARGPAQRIEAAKAAVKSALTAFAEAQRRAAAEAERARLAELEAWKKKHEQEEREAAERVRLAQAALPIQPAGAPPASDFDDIEPAPKSESQVRIEQLQHAPMVRPIQPGGVAFRVRLVCHVESVAALPEPFVIRTANEAALRATFCAGWKEGEPLPVVKGCRFEVVRDAVSTGRR